MLTSDQINQMHARQGTPYAQFSGGLGPDPRAYSNRLFGGVTPFGYGFGSNLSEGVFGGLSSAANMGMNVGMFSMLGNMAMGGLGLGSSRTLTGLSRAFGGTLGLGASMGLMMPAIAALDVGAGAIKRQNSTQAELDRAFGNRINMGGAFGYGASRNAGRDLNDAMRNIADLPDMFTSVGELSNVLKKINDMKLLQGVKSAGEFKKKFTGIVTGLRTMAKDLGTTMEEALPFLQSSTDQGFLNPQEVQENVRILNASSGVGIGVGRGTLNQLQTFGADLTRQMGGDSRLGAAGARSLSNQLSVAQSMGIISQQDMTNATGKVGEEANVDLTQQLMTAQTQFMRSGTGRFLSAALAKRDQQGNFTGEVDLGLLRKLQRGEITGDRLMELGKEALTGLTSEQALSFENESGGLSADIGSQMGVTGLAQAVNGILKASGVKGEQAQRNLIKQMLGIRQSTADMLIKTARRGAEMMDEELRQLGESTIRSARVSYYKENFTLGSALNKLGTMARSTFISPIERGFTRAGTQVANIGDEYADSIFRQNTTAGRVSTAVSGIPKMFFNALDPSYTSGFGAVETEGLRQGYADDTMRRSLGLSSEFGDFTPTFRDGASDGRRKLAELSGNFEDQLKGRFDSLQDGTGFSAGNLAEVGAKSALSARLLVGGGLGGSGLRGVAGKALGEAGSALGSMVGGTAEAGSLSMKSAQQALEKGIKPGLIQRISGKAAGEAATKTVTSGLLRRKAAGVAVRQASKALLAGTVGMLIPGLNIILALSLAKDLYDVGKAGYDMYKSGENQKDMAQALGIGNQEMEDIVEEGDEKKFRDIQLAELKRASGKDVGPVNDKDFKKAYKALAETGKLAEIMESGGSTADIMQKIGAELRSAGSSLSAGTFLGALKQGKALDSSGNVVSQPGGFFSKQAERTLSTLTQAVTTTGSVRLSRKELERKQDEMRDAFKGELFGGMLSEDDGKVYFASKTAEEFVSGSLQERKALGEILGNKELRTALSNVRTEADAQDIKSLYPQLKDIDPSKLISIAADLRDALREEGGEAEGLFDRLSQQYSALNADAINEELSLALSGVRGAGESAKASGLTPLSDALSQIGTSEYKAGSIGEASLRALDTLGGDISKVSHSGLKQGLLGAQMAKRVVGEIRNSGMRSESDVIDKYKGIIPEQILKDFFGQDSDTTISDDELKRLEVAVAERSMVGANLKGATPGEDRLDEASGDVRITENYLESARKATRANIAFTRAVYETSPQVREKVARTPISEEN